jgi:hypothetical protein
MRKWILIIALILIMASLAGCLGGEGDDDTKPPVLVQKKGTIPQQSGWIENGGNEHAHGEFTININDTNVIHIKITVRVEDSNPENQETDEGSDPDDVTVTINADNTSEEQNGMTPFSREWKFSAPQSMEDDEEPVYLSQSVGIVIDAELGGGKPMFLFGFIIYIDQGIQYTIEGEYTYMAVEESV